MKTQFSVIVVLALFAFSARSEMEYPFDMPSFDPVVGSLKGFYSGMYNALGLGELTDLMSCYGTASGGVEMAFYYQWAASVASSTPATSNNATWFYFNSTGAYLYLSIPTSVLTCVHQSHDYARLLAGVKIDVALTIVLDAFQSYMLNNTVTYYNQFTSIYQSLNSLNIYAAGQTYGQFVYNVTQLAIQMENSESADEE